jgi:CO/xanthine dehydrogenase FAD-binding subunit
MIVEYHRPDSIDEALALLSRKEPVTIPLGGGTVISRQFGPNCAVVDLQKLGLNTIDRQGDMLHIGATATIQDVVQSDVVPPALAAIANRAANYNLRQVATIGGTIAAADGRSSFLVALLAVDAEILWLPGNRFIRAGDWLPLRNNWKQGIIGQVRVPLQAVLGYEQVGRSPADQPIISVAMAKWPSGRIRIAIGGDMPLPVLAVDGSDGEEIVQVADIAYSHYRNPKYSLHYIQKTTKVLIHRLLKQL